MPEPPAALVGPHPSHIQVAKPYLPEQEIQSQLATLGSNPQREIDYRVNGVQLINEVRIAMNLPAQTYACACIYYHKFRLVHKDNEYQFENAAIAALFLACKGQDTLKKSRDVLCAAHNMKVAPAQYLSNDDPMFEGPSRQVIGLERLMLESGAFDFRSRFPHKFIVKLCKKLKVEKKVARIALDICNDMYKTFAPLKQTSFTMAFAVVELAARISETNFDQLAPMAAKYKCPRGPIMETLLDLMELYTHHTKATILGLEFSNVNVFIQLRIDLNKEMNESGLARYSHWIDKPNSKLKSTPKTPITPASPAPPLNGHNATDSPSGRKGAGARGSDGTVRFMIDGEKAREEKAIVGKYNTVEYEEYEIEVEEQQPTAPRNDRSQNSHPGRNDRFHGGGYHGRRGGRR